ncbi:MAG TPA: hypothetical protein VK196_09615 [Magnetospirillum sp.]|nr:hypothetical protein [Magnetospirillum sp.]
MILVRRVRALAVLAVLAGLFGQSAPADAADTLAQLLEESRHGHQTETRAMPGETTRQTSPDATTTTPGGQYLLRAPRQRATESGAVDSSGCWYHLKRHDAVAAQHELDRLMAENPDWTPPAELVRALKTEQVRAAQATGRTDEARRLAAELSAGASPCEQPDLAWLVQDRDGLLRMARGCPNAGVAAASLDRYLRSFPNAERPQVATALLRQTWPKAVRATLQRTAAATQIQRLNDGTLAPEDEPALQALVEQMRDGGGAEALGWKALSRKQPDAARAWFAKALAWGTSPTAGEGMGRALIALGDVDGATALAQRHPGIRPALADAHVERALAGADADLPWDTLAQQLATAAAMGRADGWEALGWRLMEHNRPDDAEKSFAQAQPGENTAYGRVLAVQAQGRPDDAETLACDQRGQSARLSTACADIVAGRQSRAYAEGDFAAAQELGERLEQIAPDHRGGRTLRAWSALRLGRAEQAADLFAALYDEAPSADLAQAVSESLRAAGREHDLTTRIAAGDTLLAREMSKRGAATAWGRKQFDLAYRYRSTLN